MRRFTFKTVALLASLASASTAFFLFAYFLWPVSAQIGTASSITFQGEVGKSLIQLGSVTIIGGFVAAFLKFVLDEDIRTRELARQSIQRRISLYNQFMERTGAAYRETKGCRRRLRSVGLTWKFGAKPNKFSEKQWEHYCDEAMRIRPCTHNPAQCPLRSESDRNGALPRNDAMGRCFTSHCKKKPATFLGVSRL
jgi:hypothetical protein